MRLALGVVVLVVAMGAFSLVLGRGPTTALGQGGMSPGSMNGMGMTQGMGMMGGPFSSSARPLLMDRAVQILMQWPADHHIDGLVLDEVEAYTENFYGQFKERSTGKGAVQVLVDRYTGRAEPEMGPNMMWNTKYGRAMMQDMMDGMGMPGMMNGGMGMGGPGMMGGTTPPGTGDIASAPGVSTDEARRLADQFLRGYYPGSHVGNAETFYGYYHFDVLRAGRQVGMLSVNSTNGQVWYHTWHGEFLQKREIAR